MLIEAIRCLFIAYDENLSSILSLLFFLTILNFNNSIVLDCVLARLLSEFFMFWSPAIDGLEGLLLASL